jgi:hypothetical protein
MATPDFLSKHGPPIVVTQITPESKGIPVRNPYRAERDTWVLDLMTPIGYGSKRIPLIPCTFHSGKEDSRRIAKVYDARYTAELNSGKTPEQADEAAKVAMYRAGFYTEGAPDFGVWFADYECYDTCSHATQKMLKEQSAAREEIKKFLDGCSQMIPPLDEMYKTFNNRLMAMNDANKTIESLKTELRKKTQDINVKDPSYMARKQLWEQAEEALEVRVKAAEISWAQTIKYQRVTAEQRYYQTCNDLLAAKKEAVMAKAIDDHLSSAATQDLLTEVVSTIVYPQFVFNDDSRAAKEGHIVRYTADETALVKRRKTDFENWVNKNTYNPVEVQALKDNFKQKQIEKESDMAEISRLAVDIYVRARYLVEQMSGPAARIATSSYGNRYAIDTNKEVIAKLNNYMLDMLDHIKGVDVDKQYKQFQTNEASAYRRLIEQKIGGTHVVKDVAAGEERIVINADGTIEKIIVQLNESELTVGNRVEIASTKVDPMKALVKETVYEQYADEDESYYDRFAEDTGGMGPDARLGMASKKEKKVEKNRKFKNTGPQRPQVKVKRNNHR